MTKTPSFVIERADKLIDDLWKLEDWQASRDDVRDMICKAMQDVVGLSIIKLGLGDTVKNMEFGNGKD